VAAVAAVQEHEVLLAPIVAAAQVASKVTQMMRGLPQASLAAQKPLLLAQVVVVVRHKPQTTQPGITARRAAIRFLEAAPQAMLRL
jgi:hypothetical protein